jgi:hypothetical protein
MARRPDVPLADGHLAAGDEGDNDVGGVAVEVLTYSDISLSSS